MNRKPVILYAEDDPDDRETTREYILSQTAAYEIIEAANGREALHYIRTSCSNRYEHVEKVDGDSYYMEGQENVMKCRTASSL
jgi:CheY-like chemotaxis protein